METMRFISVNKVMCEYTGYTRDEFLALNPWELIAEESKETRDGLLEEVFSGKRDFAFKVRRVLDGKR
jgi:two-component system cell cycle sensor histidine kinase/response regulator CckA